MIGIVRKGLGSLPPSLAGIECNKQTTRTKLPKKNAVSIEESKEKKYRKG